MFLFSGEKCPERNFCFQRENLLISIEIFSSIDDRTNDQLQIWTQKYFEDQNLSERKLLDDVGGQFNRHSSEKIHRNYFSIEQVFLQYQRKRTYCIKAYFQTQKMMMWAIHIRNEHKMRSIVDVLECSNSKKTFFAHRSSPVRCISTKSKTFFEIEQKRHLVLYIMMSWLRMSQPERIKTLPCRMRPKTRVDLNPHFFRIFGLLGWPNSVRIGVK